MSRHILVAEGAHVGGNLIGLQADVSGVSATPLENWVPQVETKFHKMYRKVTYVISVVGTAGTAPTTWSLGARFEQYLGHTMGYQDQFGHWCPIQDEQLIACIHEGVGWYGVGQLVPSQGAAYGIIANQLTPADDGSGILPNLALNGGSTIPVAGTTTAVLNTARVTVSRTVTEQLGGMRVRFQPAITGGDSTTVILLSALAIGEN